LPHGVDDLDTLFAGPLTGTLGLADAVLVRPDLVGGSARHTQSKSARDSAHWRALTPM
jgi:hypothetical protein